MCLGYKGYLIKEYVAKYFLHMSDVTFDMAQNKMEVLHEYSEPWRVTLLDTGQTTMTGGRLRRVAEHVRGEDAFCFTYGDGIANVDFASLFQFHRSHGKLATVTAVQPAGRFGSLDMRDGNVRGFIEKPKGDGGWINGGFFVLSPKVLDYISGDETSWEEDPLVRLAGEGNLMAFEHRGFWQPMDTLRDKNLLEELWSGGAAPWKTW